MLYVIQRMSNNYWYYLEKLWFWFDRDISGRLYLPGYSKHFGLYAVDFANGSLSRTPRLAVSTFQHLATTNAVDPEVTNQDFSTCLERPDGLRREKVWRDDVLGWVLLQRVGRPIGSSQKLDKALHCWRFIDERCGCTWENAAWWSEDLPSLENLPVKRQKDAQVAAWWRKDSWERWPWNESLEKVLSLAFVKMAIDWLLPGFGFSVFLVSCVVGL